jgi:uncharacterized membrane protein
MYQLTRKPVGAVPSALSNPLVQAGLVLGAGFTGLADGIVFHQVLGWHHLVCVTEQCAPASIGQLQLQNTQDGWFHLVLWLVLLAGTVMLFRAARPAGASWRGSVLLGAMLAGGGLFNIAEGVVNHHLLGIHHVLPGSPHRLLLDLVWLASGALFYLAGAWLIRSPRD